jgi:hypothetical protein
MTNKKLVFGSMFSMLLGSGMAAAGWGDVYYCQMTNNNEISIEGETLEKHKLEKFKFKLDQTRNAMVFGNTGHFKDQSFLLSADMTNDKDPEFVTTQALLLQMEIWYANSEDSNTKFSKGKFLYASVSSSGVQIISADCDKF